MAVPRSNSNRSIITIKGIESLRVGLTDLQQQQFPFAMKNAINATTAKIKDATVAQMHVQFKSPTPFTLNSMRQEFASKANLSGAVRFKDPTRLSESQHYLYPNTYGTRRGFKKFEAALYKQGIMPANHYAMPGKGVQLDGYGNVPSSLIVQLLSYFSAFNDGGYKSNITDATKAKRKKGSKKKYGFEYFALRKASNGMLPGIYRRTFTPFGTAIDSMFIFVPTSHVWYTRLYSFHETGKRIFEADFKTNFGNELQKAMETALK